MPDTTPTGIPDGISEWDFGELLLFDHKVQQDGFPEALREYQPDFRDPALRKAAEDYDAMHDLYQKYADTIDALWAEGTAGDMYDAHLDATRTADS